MENNFNEDNFEEFLQDQLQNHRMFPKDSVWREINIKLHGEKRWPALTFASFLLISITTFICLHFSARQNIFTTKPVLIPLQTEKSLAELNPHSTNKSTVSPFNTSTKQHTSFNGQILLAPQTNNTIPSAIEAASNVNSDLVGVPLQAETDILLNESTNLSNNKFTTSTTTLPANELAQPSFGLENSSDQSLTSLIAFEDLAKANAKSDIKDAALVPPTLIPNIETSPEVAKNNPVVNSLEDKALSLIEKFKATKKPGKLNMLVYLAPSISYRKLVEDQSVLKGNNNGPVGVNQVADVNDVVRHKPSKGIEGGLSLLYDFTKKVRIRSGFQFNVRQYSIDAYKSNTEVSSIALVQEDGIDTLNTLVFYRNFNGNTSAELVNRYYQISMPIGLEWEVVGNKRFQFNIAGSIQPTYILNRSAYLLTTNFKNYSENDNFVRQWNVNTNFEAFVSMVVGDVKWQLGPQIRYQPSSTFISQYPIREHLIDYGIKLGISTRLK